MTDSYDAFTRQRRNLIGASLVVVFVNLATVRLEKINLLGNELQISQPNALPIALAAVLSYFLVRYMQYMHDIEDKGFLSRFHRRIEKYLRPYILKREHRKPDSRLNLQHGKRRLSELEVEDFVMFDKAMPPNTAAASFLPIDGGVVVEEGSLNVSNSELIWPLVRAALYVLIRTRLVTDYVLPLILACFAYLTYFSSVRSVIQNGL